MDQNKGESLKPSGSVALVFWFLESMTDVAEAKSLGSVGTYYWSGRLLHLFLYDPKENLEFSILMTQLLHLVGFYEAKMRQMVFHQAIE